MNPLARNDEVSSRGSCGGASAKNYQTFWAEHFLNSTFLGCIFIFQNVGFNLYFHTFENSDVSLYFHDFQKVDFSLYLHNFENSNVSVYCKNLQKVT